MMKNYSRFFGLLARLPVHTEQMKEEFVHTYTNGRTSSLRDMNPAEYTNMCNALEKSLTNKSELRSCRSAALNLMQRLGIDTTDWTRINAFCEDKRIAGKQFYQLSIAELESLAVKLRSIARNGGLNPRRKEPEPKPQIEQQKVIYIPFTGGGEA